MRRHPGPNRFTPRLRSVNATRLIEKNARSSSRTVQGRCAWCSICPFGGWRPATRISRSSGGHELRVTCSTDSNPETRNVKATLHTRYGSPDLLRFKEVDKPAPKDNEVLIRVHTATVSTGDCNMRNFTFVTKSMLPMAKLMFGIGKPWKERILGTELAGAVVGAGKDVTRFKVGDRVFGSTGMAGGGFPVE